MSPSILVVKRDGSKEPFDPENITRVTIAAGLTKKQAALLTGRISKWAKALDQPEITSLAIRDEVLTELESIDEKVANFFRWYQKTKDLPSPEFPSPPAPVRKRS